jgi:hypothetical protein
MSFLLDNTKNNLASLTIPVSPDNVIVIYSGFAVVPNPSTDGAYFSILESGSVTVGGNGSDTVTLGAPVGNSFIEVTDPVTSYTILSGDYIVEIVSDTVNTILLPQAAGIGGKMYIISRRSNNDALVVQAAIGDDMDSRSTIQLSRKYDRINIMSNNLNTWYFV